MDTDQMVWDFSQLVESTVSGSIQKSLDSMVAEARKVREQYHGKTGGLE